MSKSAKKRSSDSKASSNASPANSQSKAASNPSTTKVRTDLKQSRVIAMLQSPAGATITAIMKVTGWQPHSVRGFLAGVVRKRLKLKLDSAKVDGTRVYHIARKSAGKTGPRSTIRRTR